MPFKSEKQRKWMHANQPEMAKKWEKEENMNEMEYHTWPENPEPHPVGDHHKDEVKETAKRDYKDEYKKFQSSPKSKKYRAELNKYNRKKGTYGNGDGKDASHKGGKISGFEKESVNRGRREKSRLKKEQKLREVIRKIIDEDFAGSYPKHMRKEFDNKRRKQSEVLGYKLTGKNDVKTETDDATVKEHMAGGLTYKKGKTVTVTHKTSGKELVIIDNPKVKKEYEKIGYFAEGKITEKKETGIDIAKRIVKNHQHEKGVDVQTANLILKIHQAYAKNPSLQKKFEKLPLKKLAQGVWRFVKWKN